MAKLRISDSRYTYLNEDEWSPDVIDIHQVIVRKSFFKPVLVSLGVLLLVNSFYLFFFKENWNIMLVWSFILSGLLIILLLWNPVYKESVVIMPTFGVQIETHYSSGRIIRQFVPFDKILKPLLIECVTPVTCYWSLSLIIRDEEEFMLIFKELRPPLKMLRPVWKALCLVIDTRDDD